MLVQLAYVQTPDGKETVLRSSPEGVAQAVAHAKGKVLFKTEREVQSAAEEFLFCWLDFVVEADRHGKMESAEKAIQMFYRKGMNLWTTFGDIPNVAVFPPLVDDLIIQVSKTTFQ